MKLEWFCIFVFACSFVECRTCSAQVGKEISVAVRALKVLCPARLRLAPIFGRAAHRYHVPADLLVSVSRVESNCDPHAVGQQGELGLMQVKPGPVAAGGVSEDRIRLPRVNVSLGAAHLERRFRLCGDWAGALGVYKGWKKCRFGRESDYAERVLGFLDVVRGADKS